jgi:hypothetical protein
MTLDDRLQRAVDTLGEKLRDQFRDDLTRELQSLSEEIKAQVPPAPPVQADNGALVRLAHALRTLDESASLSGILDALASAASGESARAGVFLVREGEVRSFRLFGFPARYEDAPIALPFDDAGVVRDAIVQRGVVTSATSPFDELPPGIDALAFPLVLAGSAVGALYVEGADPTTMDILTRFASRALEAHTALITARAIAGADV